MKQQATYFAPGGACDGRTKAVMFGAGDTQRIEVELGKRPRSAAVQGEVRAYWRNGKIWKLHLTGQQSRRGWKSMFRRLASQVGGRAKTLMSSLKTWYDGSSNSQTRVTNLFS